MLVHSCLVKTRNHQLLFCLFRLRNKLPGRKWKTMLLYISDWIRSMIWNGDMGIRLPEHSIRLTWIANSGCVSLRRPDWKGWYWRPNIMTVSVCGLQKRSIIIFQILLIKTEKAIWSVNCRMPVRNTDWNSAFISLPGIVIMPSTDGKVIRKLIMNRSTNWFPITVRCSNSGSTGRMAETGGTAVPTKAVPLIRKNITAMRRPAKWLNPSIRMPWSLVEPFRISAGSVMSRAGRAKRTGLLIYTIKKNITARPSGEWKTVINGCRENAMSLFVRDGFIIIAKTIRSVPFLIWWIFITVVSVIMPISC